MCKLPDSRQMMLASQGKLTHRPAHSLLQRLGWTLHVVAPFRMQPVQLHPKCSTICSPSLSLSLSLSLALSLALYVCVWLESHCWRPWCAEAWARNCPSVPVGAQLLVEFAAARPADANFSAWALPLAAGALASCVPPAPVHTWLRARAPSPPLLCTCALIPLCGLTYALHLAHH